jgi:hypothetical protein
MTPDTDGTAEHGESGALSLGLVDDVSDEPVSVDGAGDYMVPLQIEGLPEGTVSIDYFPDTPQLVIEREATDVELVVEDHETSTTVKFEVGGDE